MAPPNKKSGNTSSSNTHKVKIKNKANKGATNTSHYHKKKEESRLAGLTDAQLKIEKDNEKIAKAKKREKKEKRVVVRGKVQQPTLSKEDDSFFDKDIFQNQSYSKFDSVNFNENYESKLFGDMMNDNDDDDGVTDLDDLYFDENALEDGGFNHYDQDEEIDQDDDYENPFSNKKKNSSGKKQQQIELEQIDKDLLSTFPSVSESKKLGTTNKKDGSISSVREEKERAESFEDDGDDEDGDGENSKKKKKKSGGFQSMDLNKNLLKAILRKGFKVPTPIQRNSIPLILQGKDIVGAARTGSGKTAAFVIPMIQKLGQHSTKVGARAVILSPTRELSIQTYKVVKELAFGTDLRYCLIVGGDNMEDQFSELARNPDIIIATPGRLMHHLQETGMGLSAVEYVVFDEADRLFEMGFSEQLTEILSKLRENRQTLLFSATLPSLLVDFVRAGLHNPELVRPPNETKISDLLSLSFYTLRQEEKFGVLLYLLRELIDPGQLTMVFTSTKYHVEFLQILLERSGIPCTFIHGYLDPIARKINLARFRSHQVGVMIVTDLAARGIDIPLLDNVINFDFPPNERIFVHRVGRVARAGRKGTAYSLVSPDEVAYMIDLHLYLGRKMINKLESPEQLEDTSISLYGNIPQNIIDRQTEFVNQQKSSCIELFSLTKTISNAHKKYILNRKGASHESNKRAKLLDKSQYHPSLGDKIDNNELIRNDFILSLKTFRPPQTVLEMGNGTKNANNISTQIMQEKRKFHSQVIESQIKKQKLESNQIKFDPLADDYESKLNAHKKVPLSKETDNFDRFDELFGNSTNSKKQNNSNDNDEEMEDEIENEPELEEDEDEEGEESTKQQLYKVVVNENNENVNSKKRTRSSSKDEAFFLSSTPSNLYEERAMSVTKNFNRDVEVNYGPDDERAAKHKGTMKWDRKKGNFVNVNAEKDRKSAKKFVRNEAGKLVVAEKNKKGGYEEWKKKNRSRIQRAGEQEDMKSAPAKPSYTPVKWRGKNKSNKDDNDSGSRKFKNEIKDRRTILKETQERDKNMKTNKSKGKPKKKK
eukprot:gene6595-8163_t